MLDAVDSVHRCMVCHTVVTTCCSFVVHAMFGLWAGWPGLCQPPAQSSGDAEALLLLLLLASHVRTITWCAMRLQMRRMCPYTPFYCRSCLLTIARLAACCLDMLLACLTALPGRACMHVGAPRHNIPPVPAVHDGSALSACTAVLSVAASCF